MLTIIAHLFIYPNQEAAFAKYEEQALHIFREHGGQLIRAIRPTQPANETNNPYEIHILEIPASQWAAFRADARHQTVNERRQTIIRHTELFISDTVVAYPPL